MEMSVSDAGGNVLRVNLHGRLDTPGVDVVETRLTATLVPGGHSAVVDLSGVEFVGSMAIRMFLSIAKALARKGRRLVLFAPSPQVADVFAMASLGEVIPIAADAEAALANAGA
jgi:anti-anti-sigma factor